MPNMSNETNKTIQQLESVNSNFAKKPDMLTAIKTAIATLKDIEANKFDPAAEAQAQKTLELLQRVDGLSAEDVQKEVTDLTTYIVNALTKLATEFVARVNEYAELKQGIDLKRAQLKDVYKIDEEYQNLVATINSHAAIKAEFDATHGQAVKDAEARVAELTEEAAGLEAKLKAERDAAEAQLAADIKREKDEHSYNFGREKKKQTDDLEDELKTTRAVHNETTKARDEALDKREAQINADKADVGKREGILKSGTDKLAKDREEFETKFEARVTLEVDRKVELAKAIKDAELGVEIAKREAAEARVAALETQVAALQVQVTAAYADAQKVAMAAVDGTQAKTALDRVADMTKSNTNSK